MRSSNFFKCRNNALTFSTYEVGFGHIRFTTIEHRFLKIVELTDK